MRKGRAFQAERTAGAEAWQGDPPISKHMAWSLWHAEAPDLLSWDPLGSSVAGPQKEPVWQWVHIWRGPKPAKLSPPRPRSPETVLMHSTPPTPASVAAPLPGPQIPLQAGCPQRGDRRACWPGSAGFGPQRQTGSRLGTRWSRVFASGHVPSKAPEEAAGDGLHQTHNQARSGQPSVCQPRRPHTPAGRNPRPAVPSLGSAQLLG